MVAGYSNSDISSVYYGDHQGTAYIDGLEIRSGGQKGKYMIGSIATLSNLF